MKLIVKFLTVLFCCFFFGCSSKEDDIRKIGAKPLKNAARLTLERYRASGQPDAPDIPSTHWAKEIQMLNAKSVKIYMEGVLVVTKETNRYQEGVYICTDQKDPEDWSGGSGVEVEKILDNVYTVSIKLRRAP